MKKTWHGPSCSSSFCLSSTSYCTCCPNKSCEMITERKKRSWTVWDVCVFSSEVRGDVMNWALLMIHWTFIFIFVWITWDIYCLVVLIIGLSKWTRYRQNNYTYYSGFTLHGTIMSWAVIQRSENSEHNRKQNRVGVWEMQKSIIGKKISIIESGLSLGPHNPISD